MNRFSGYVARLDDATSAADQLKPGLIAREAAPLPSTRGPEFATFAFVDNPFTLLGRGWELRGDLVWAQGETAQPPGTYVVDMHLKNIVLGEQNQDGSWPIKSATITGSGWRGGYVREDPAHTFTVTAK